MFVSSLSLPFLSHIEHFFSSYCTAQPCLSPHSHAGFAFSTIIIKLFLLQTLLGLHAGAQLGERLRAVSPLSYQEQKSREEQWDGISFSSPPFPPFPYEHDDSLWQNCTKLLKRQPQNMYFFFLTSRDTLKKAAHTFNDTGLNYPLPAFGAIFKHYILRWSSVLNCYIWFIEVNSKTSKCNSTVMSLCCSRAIVSKKDSFFLTLTLNCTNPSELEITP